ncbi:MAG: hypothetical protein IJC59_01300 [Lachnospiraceae bacterium]|nr:hypothetical protein [Lachnospiraceae bacterium]
MRENRKKPMLLLAVLLIVATVCMFAADRIQRDGGNIRVSYGRIETEAGDMTYKLYVPAAATADTPAPAVLLLHGYQNDGETCAAYSIELARRGAVVMALDEYGHGRTEIGLSERGHVNHKVTVNFGEESKEEGTFVSIGGANRYRVMMNFSNLSFFDKAYSSDAEGNTIRDSSAGGVAAYGVLADMDCVDNTRMAVSGHSMGTWSSWTVAAAYSNAVNEAGESIAPKAMVLQCGELFRESVYDAEKIRFNNVLLLQAKYEEFGYFRDYELTVTDALLKSDLRTEFLGCDAKEAAWNTTYGNMAEGTARRIELLHTNHRLTTHNDKGLTASMQWIGEAVGLDTSLTAHDHTAMTKEFLVMAAMVCCVAAMLPLMELLLAVPFFAGVVQPLPGKEGIKTGRRWWKGAMITILIAAVTYPFMTQLGHGLLPLPEKIFRMSVGNGFLSWYLILILIMLLTTLISRRAGKKAGGSPSLYEMGLSSAGKPDQADWSLYGKGALLVLCMVGMLYGMTALFESLFKLDLRFIWPFFKTFTIARLGQFFVYLPIYVLFYLLNNSKIMAGMRTEGTYRKGAKGFVSCWWRYALVMTGGVLIVTLLEYIPFFMGIGPGADVFFGSTFGGPFMSLLILFVPQVVAFSLICTYTYRRTGNVCTGAFTAAALSCWIVTGGSAML